MLYPLDQLHGRQIAATREHLPRLRLDEGKHVLDVGSGIGGPARFMAATWGCRVTGIDLTAEFVAAARELTERCGLSGKVDFRRGDALHMPFADASFDRAACLHVAMNIADKPGLLREIRRVLKPSGRLVWSEIVRRAAPPDYPSHGPRSFGEFSQDRDLRPAPCRGSASPNGRTSRSLQDHKAEAHNASHTANRAADRPRRRFPRACNISRCFEDGLATMLVVAGG
jgi:SAM-dependent methyltransferase